MRAETRFAALVAAAVVAVSVAGCGHRSAPSGGNPLPASVENGAAWHSVAPDSADATAELSENESATHDAPTDGTQASLPAAPRPGTATRKGLETTSRPASSTPARPAAPRTSEVKVGVLYAGNAGAANAALGARGVGQFDQKAAWQALIDDVNESGGVAGSRLVPVWFEVDQLANREIVDQQACAAFTEDTPVFGVFLSGTDTFRSCLSRAGIVQVGWASGLSDSATFEQFPYLVEVGGPALDRSARLGVGVLADSGYYESSRDNKPVKVGLVAYDRPVFDRAAATLRRALAERGLELSEEIRIHLADFADYGHEITALHQAAIRFKQRGITHVQFLATRNGRMQMEFMRGAEAQEYHPLYGLTSYDNAQVAVTQLGPVAHRQLEGAMIAGWLPLSDVARSEYTGDRLLPALRRCKDVVARSGATYNDESRANENRAAQFCDTVWYFRAAMEAGGGDVDTTSFLRGVAAIDRMDSAQTFVIRTSARRRDAMGAVQLARFFSDCPCFKYVGNLRSVGDG